MSTVAEVVAVVGGGLLLLLLFLFSGERGLSQEMAAAAGVERAFLMALTAL
jgi:hypothetical protein